MNTLGMRQWIIAILLAVACGFVSVQASPAPDAQARDILSATGVQGGLIVHLGCGDGKLTAALRANDRFLVHGLDANPANIAAARKHIQSLGLNGPVVIELFSGDRLPYIENFVNLLVAENVGNIPMSEVMRVLVPNGVAYIRSGGAWTKTVKPRPANIDDWTHYLHDPSNNAVAHDTAIAPPNRLQWLGSPRYSRHHDHMSAISAMVSANGRTFYIFDEGPHASIFLPPNWQVVARDAFNGTLLWKRPIAQWHTHLYRLKSGPAVLPRRLVASGDRVYVTLGIVEPLTALDAATGEIVRTYEGTKATEEILFDNGVLYLVVASEGQPLRSDPSRKITGIASIMKELSDLPWGAAPRTIMAVEESTGKILWKKDFPVAPLTLALDKQQVYFYEGKSVRALRRDTGEPVWSSEPVPPRPAYLARFAESAFAPTLVVSDGVVMFSNGAPLETYANPESSTMLAFSAADGKTLWKAEHPACGHGNPKDLLIVGGNVWFGHVAQGNDSGVMTARDLHTGEIKKQFPPDVVTHWFHHRCYRAKATDNYLLFSRTGIEFIDVATNHWVPHHWVRGGCLYGIMPANGLIYSPPHPCACYIEAKLFGFNAIAPPTPEWKPLRDVPDAGRLQRGPAYDSIGNPQSPLRNEPEWPTYRANPARSGAIPFDLADKTDLSNLKLLWQTPLGGKLSAVTIAEGKLFVASVDAHAVHALDAHTGKPVWTFTAGGRVDSPPTIWQGRVLFGSADGYVYCLRASDGELAWRFRAAPEDRRLGSFEQLESVWPVHGSVLVQNDTVYCVAGRSLFLDGGMRLLRLDPKTGQKLSETILDDRDPETQKNMQIYVNGLNMPVALPDILSSDGRYVYMRSLPFTLEGKRKYLDYQRVNDQRGDDVHLFSPTGFLDATMWHRTYWVYGRAFASGAGGYFQAGKLVPAGRLLVFNDANVYGYGRLWQYYRWSTPYEFHLFGTVKQPSVVRMRPDPPAKKKKDGTKAFTASDLPTTRFDYVWSDEVPIQVNAMVLTGKTLFIAGPPDIVNEEEAMRSPNSPETQQKLAEQLQAMKGERGAFLAAVSATDGRQHFTTYRLDSMPVFDGMAVAYGRLYFATSDGKLMCIGAGEGKALTPAADVSAKPRPPDAPIAAPEAPTPPEVDLSTDTLHVARPGAGLDIASDDFQKIAGATVFWSDQHGYRVCADPGANGLALKRMPKPLNGKVTMKCTMKMDAASVEGLSRVNGFLVFGDSPLSDGLVQCGILQKQGRMTIAEGSRKKAAVSEQKTSLSADQPHELVVTVDLAANEVTLTVGKQTVVKKLERPLKNISWIGYAVQSAVTDFTPVDVAAPGFVRPI